MHNGLIRDFHEVKRDLVLEVDPSLYPAIEGSTDSEVFFFLALTLGLEDDPPAAVEHAVGLIESVGRRHGVEHPIQMTVATTDGRSVWAFRYSSEGKLPVALLLDARGHASRAAPRGRGAPRALRRVAAGRVRAARRPRGRLERGARIELRSHPGGSGRASAVHAAAAGLGTFPSSTRECGHKPLRDNRPPRFAGRGGSRLARSRWSWRSALMGSRRP